MYVLIFEPNLKFKVMEMQIEKRSVLSDQSGLFFKIGELLMVFVPVVLLFTIMSSWIGENPIRSQVVVWGAYIIMFVMIWLGLKIRNESWADLGVVFETISFKGFLKVFGWSLIVCVLGVAGFILGSVLMANVTGIPEAADFSKYDFLKDNLGGLFLTLGGVYIVSSFGEEVVFRAFLINRIEQIGALSKYGTAMAVVLSSMIFGLAHYEWGPMGMVQTAFMGLAMGVCYIKFKRRIWILVLAHVYMDTILMVQMYLASN